MTTFTLEEEMMKASKWYTDKKLRYGVIAGVFAFATYHFSIQTNDDTGFIQLKQKCQAHEFEACDAMFERYTKLRAASRVPGMQDSELIQLHKTLAVQGYDYSIDELTGGLFRTLPSGKYVINEKIDLLDIMLK
ncbi:hypothetical protein [Vibrio chaetopteri]|jgi:hypothetical protein|uniref:Uncharacterized protein n=1 Tax=Vibrio chaetopteri TaxID=3016528 RepID=A0AAU8BSG4_9VIBR